MAEPLPSPDELRRQRELVANHLAWLDRQIAHREAEAGGASPSTLASGAGTPMPAPRRDVAAPAAGADPEAILEQFRVEPTNVTRDVRRGCLVYFAAAFLVLGAVVALLYVTLR